MIISITGASGSGKSTLSKQILNKYKEKAIYIEIDKIGHQVLTIKEIKQELLKNFGNKIIDANNINRKKLGEIVFNQRLEMKKLTQITWKYMEEIIDKTITENKDKIIILDWLLLPITKYFDLSDKKILLDIPYETRKNRAIKRDNISEQDFNLREKNSIQFNKYNFDYTIKDKESLERTINLI